MDAFEFQLRTLIKDLQDQLDSLENRLELLEEPWEDD